MKITKLIFIFLGLIFNSCSYVNQEKFELIIDNPSDTELQLKFNSEDLVIAPKSFKKKTVKGASHTLKYGQLDTTVYLFEKVQYLINPTLATYFKEEVVFMSDDKKYSRNIDLSDIKMKYFPIGLLNIEDTIPVIGPYKEISNTLLIKSFDYDISQDIPFSEKSKDLENIHKVKLYRYIDFLKELSKTNETLHKRYQLLKLAVEKPGITRVSIDYLKEREKLLSQIMPKSEGAVVKMSIMEINAEGEYSTVIMYGDSTAILLNSTGYLLKSKFVLNDKTTKDKEQTLISALSFFNNTSAIVRAEKNIEPVDQFALPDRGEVFFHSWDKGSKYSKKIAHDVLIQNSMKPSYTTPFDMLYSQGYKIIKLLNDQD